MAVTPCRLEGVKWSGAGEETEDLLSLQLLYCLLWTYLYARLCICTVCVYSPICWGI